MANSYYEPHIMENSALPFIFHFDSLRTAGILPFNWHTNTEILYCLEGEGYVSVDDRIVPFRPGDITVINSNRLHRVDTESAVRYNVLIADRGFCADNGIPTDEILFEERITDDQYLKQAFDEIIRCYSLTEKTRIPQIRCAILKFFIRLYGEHTLSENISAQSSVTVERIKSVIRFIRQNLSRDMTLDEIAAHAGVSKFHLAREFKKISGQTIFEHINTVRCKEAKRLMENGMSVSAAAMSCGFENMSYFSRTYKKYAGTLPSEVKIRDDKTSINNV